MKRWFVFALILSLILAAGAAWAEESRFDINVPAGDLGGAVETLAHQTKLQVLYDKKLLDGKTTPSCRRRAP